MRRPKKPLPLELSGIRHNPNTGLYTITENGNTFHMTIEHTRLLKQYYRNKGHSVNDWYEELDRFTKKEVKREGVQNKTNDGFYPDYLPE